MNFTKTKKVIKIIAIVVVCGFALIGFIFLGVYVAMRLHLTDVKGSIDSRNEFFNKVKSERARLPNVIKIANITKSESLNPELECDIMTISTVLPENGKRILDTYIATKNSVIVEKMVNAIILVTENNNSFLKNKLDQCKDVSNNILLRGDDNLTSKSVFNWMASTEWETLRDALIKDKDVINQASRDSGVSARIIISSVIAEQFRFFTANRESYKRYFEPMKVLGNGTKFSYGVAGVKIETARVIESNLKNKNSSFYLGKEYEDIFNYGYRDPETELLSRLTDNQNHYYSYLYTAIFLKEIMNQWATAGYSINDRPEVLATLFNLGFNKSVPKASPEVGGSTITINDRDYTFGGLSYEFYYSGELLDYFPFEI